jgi:hypothetical protein
VASELLCVSCDGWTTEEVGKEVNRLLVANCTDDRGEDGVVELLCFTSVG